MNYKSRMYHSYVRGRSVLPPSPVFCQSRKIPNVSPQCALKRVFCVIHILEILSATPPFCLSLILPPPSFCYFNEFAILPFFHSVILPTPHHANLVVFHLLIPTFCLSPQPTHAILPSSHSAILSAIRLLFCHTSNSLFSHCAILQPSQSPRLPFSHSPIPPFCHSASSPSPSSPILPFSYSPILPICHAATLPLCCNPSSPISFHSAHLPF